jgi:hypothetical protein
MKTGFRGTFVIPWSQTELDGTWSAPTESLRVGATWSWTGEAVRVDGPAGVMPLGPAAGVSEQRRRAARAVRRLLRAVETGTLPPEAPDDGAPPEQGFTVTDGRATWIVSLIPTGPGRLPLCLFAGEIPPRHTDLWIVSHSVDLARRDEDRDAPGGIICFTPGTLILTAEGPRPVETVAPGMRLQTKDNGCAEVLWTGRRRITGARLHAMPHLAPVRLREGALDRGVPDTGILVSPDHRLVLRGARARALFNEDEVLVAARDLVNDDSVVVERGLREVTYIHLLLPSHQIVFANGVETESFHPASAALVTMEDSQLAAMFAQLPGLAADPQGYGDYARRVLSRSEAAILRYDWGTPRAA